MPLDNGERQVAPSIEGIRADHVKRYEWAARRLYVYCPGARVIDFACGIGYGARILADRNCAVFAIDRDVEAIDYGKKHYAGPGPLIQWMPLDDCALAAVIANKNSALRAVDAAVCFETIEHIEDPKPMLLALRSAAPRLYASVPNEAVFPHNGRVLHHFRHYTAAEFEQLLAECGWRVRGWWGQEGPESPVEAGLFLGRTLVVEAERGPLFMGARPESGDQPREARAKIARPVAREESEQRAEDLAPGGKKHIAIIGLGPSAEAYMALIKRLGSRKAFADEVWAINALGDVLQCDRVFHMDDVRIQELRAAAQPDGNIAAMLAWLKTVKTPVVTSRAHPDYPALVEFPLERALNDLGYAYFNSTAAYAVAMAILEGARKISLFGIDFTYPNAHSAEKGRACVEFWLGVAAERDIDLSVAEHSSLLDSCDGDAPLYGYDAVDVTIARDETGAATVTFTEKDELPAAEEIERRYDHRVHPNKLVREGR